MNRRQTTRIGVALGAALVLGIAIVSYWLSGSDPAGVEKEPEPRAASRVEPIADPTLDRRAAGARVIDAASATPSEAAMPEPYRKALSGVTGRVVEPDGTPAPGFVVTLLEFRLGPIFSSLGETFDAAGPPPSLEIDETVTGEDGRFRLAGAIGWAFHGLGVNLGGPRATLRIMDREFPRGEIVDVGDIVLAPNLVFTGRVVDEGGTGVAGARVRATSAPAIIFQGGVEHVRPTSRVIAMHEEKAFVFEIPAWILEYEKRIPVPTATTDELGRYRLEGVPRGLASVVADREGFVALAVPSIPTGDGPEREIEPLVLTHGRTLRGRVVDLAGKPVAGAEVIGGAVVPVGFAAIAKGATGKTGDDGRFAIENVPVLGAAAVAARTERHLPWKILGPTYDDENAEIVLDDATSLFILLRGAAGDVVPTADIRLRPWVEDLGGFPLALSPYLDAGGRVRKVEDGTLAVDGVRSGRYELIGRAPRRGFAKADVTVAATGTTEVTLEFPVGRDIAVSVMDDATGAPIEWATVSALTVPMEMHAIDRRRTGADGRCTLSAIPIAGSAGGAAEESQDGAPTGLVRVVAEHPAYARFAVEVDPAAGEAEIVARLVAGGTLSGRVHDGGALPKKPVMVTLMRRDETSAGADGAIPRMSIVDLEGKFKLAHLEPGVYRYEVMDRFLDTDPLEFMTKAMTLEVEPRSHRSDEVTIVAGETVEIEIDIGMGALGPVAYLRGVVTVNGEPLQNGSVNLWREGLSSSLRASTDERGEFQFGEVPSGQVQLQVMRRNMGEGGVARGRESVHSVQLELAPGEDRYLEIAAIVVDVTVAVVTPDGSPAEGANVNMVGRSEATRGKHGYGHTGDEGYANVVVGAPGPYSATATLDGVGRVSREVEVTRGMETIVLELERGVSFTGTVTFDDGTDPADLEHSWVSLERQESGHEGDRQGTQVDAESKTFEFSNVSPGRHALTVYYRNGWSESVQVDIPPEGLSGYAVTARRRKE